MMPQVVLKTATAVGHTCHGDPRPETLDAAVEGLFGVATNKAEEVQFAAGEALCHVFGGAPTPSLTQTFTFSTNLTRPRTCKQKLCVNRFPPGELCSQAAHHCLIGTEDPLKM